ncbi:MAG: sel1 repeat family protein [Akkermansia sp.]|nr:sel1 repeat family protein [Akkermansia sp.]
MKKIALTSVVMLSGAAAFSAEAPADNQTKPANCPAACCEQAKGGDDNCDCWVDMETITIEAANGNPIAQYVIAWVTENGTDETSADPDKAKEMYTKALPGLEKAAEAGDPAACCALAKMYADGKGVEKNPEKAKELMERCQKLMEAKKAQKAAENSDNK